MDGYVTIGTKLDTKSFDAQIDYVKGQLDDIEDKLKQADMGFEVGDVQKLEAQYEKLTDKLRDLIKKKEEFNKEKMFDFSGVQQSIEGVGKSVKKVTKRITKMALAVFGIRSAFMFVRNSINTIASNDEQLKADIDYMKSALAYTLEPLVRGIVNLAKQLMFYVGYIVNEWFGANIFKNANKGLEQATGNAKNLNKELNKTTASFDEMNTLQDSSSGGAGGVAPSFDLSAPEDYPIPGWIKWIADNGDLIIDILAGITAGLVALKLGFTGIQALGIGIAVAGLARTIQKIIDFIKKPTFKNFMGILEGIAITVAGIAIAFGAWPVAIGAAIALIVIELVNHFDEVKKMFGKLVDWIDKDFRGMLVKIFGPLGNLIADPFIWAVNYISTLFNGLFGGIKQIIDGIVLLFRGDFKGGISEIFSGMLDILMAPFNAMAQFVQEVFNGVCNTIIEAINWIIRQLNKIHFKLPGWIPGIGGKSFGIDLEELPRLGETKAPKTKKGGFWDNLIKNIPKLAVGGVINQPGRGVPIASAIGGERGAEGVIPLTDSQQMALLGETIGRYVNISATIPVYVGNRKVAREVRKIQANEDFAFNR